MTLRMVGSTGERGRRNTGNEGGAETGRKRNRMKRKIKRSDLCCLCSVSQLTHCQKKTSAVTSEFGNYGLMNETEFSVLSFHPTINSLTTVFAVCTIRQKSLSLVGQRMQDQP